MQPVARHDPAPSRLNYRMQRLLLTPVFRLVLRVGLPFMVTFGGATLWFANQDNRDAFNLMVHDLRATVEQRPEFMVKVMAIDGASASVAEDIREILPIDFPVSSFDLDLAQLRETISGLDAVKTASVRVRSGGVLQVDVQERRPVVIWRSRDGLELIDETGVLVAPAASRLDWPDLPVIAGDGAHRAVSEALALLEVARPLAARLRGLERMGERRWDVVLDRDQRILLPEDGAVPALERVIALDQALDLLARDVAAVDLRLPGRPTLRMTEHAVTELRRIRAIEAGEN